jgi:hypothetical protein
MSWATATGMDSAIGERNDEDLRRMIVAIGNLLRVQHEKTLLKAFVKEKLFPRCKFLQLEGLGHKWSGFQEGKEALELQER